MDLKHFQFDWQSWTTRYFLEFILIQQVVLKPEKFGWQGSESKSTQWTQIVFEGVFLNLRPFEFLAACNGVIFFIKFQQKWFQGLKKVFWFCYYFFSNNTLNFCFKAFLLKLKRGKKDKTWSKDFGKKLQIGNKTDSN